VNMTKRKHVTLMDQVRQAVDRCDSTRYEISKVTGIDQATLCRFVHGEQGLSEKALNSLGQYLGLDIVVRKKKSKGK
jgi:hypothetical protein